VLHCLVYVVVLQLTIAVISGAMFEKEDIDIDEMHWVVNSPLIKDHDAVVGPDKLKLIRAPTAMSSNMTDEFGMEVPVHQVPVEYEKRDRMMKCYARLLAHMAGFAAINAGATMQQLKIFHHWACLFIPIVIVLSINMIVFKLFEILRHLSKEHSQRELEFGREWPKHKRAKMMNEEVFEAENEMCCLSVSFLFIQVVRFLLTGNLPNAEGVEPGTPQHSAGNIIALYAIAVYFAFLACIMVIVKAQLAAQSEEHDEEEEEEEEETFLQRVVIIGVNSTSMSFAWGTLWATRWLAIAIPAFDMPSIMGRVCVALILSAISCAAVFCLDFVDDMHRGSEDSKAGAKAIQIMVSALAILIGFSWEHTFDGGVHAVAHATPYPETVKFFMGIIIAGVMIPMWRRHILTKEVALEHRKQEYEEEQAKHLS